MCLIVSAKAKIRRANKERVCYKVLRKDGEQLRAPYFGTSYEVGIVAFSDKALVFKPISNYQLYDNKLMVEEGLHSYIDVHDAFEQLASLSFAYEDVYVIAECTIPVGAHYVAGKTFEGTKSIVSDKLIVERIFLKLCENQ